MAKEIIIKCSDGYTLSANLHEPSNPKGIIIIAGAIGVKQGYYSRFADFFYESNYTAVTFDYRGTGKSNDNACSNLELSDWGAKDIEAVILFFKSKGLPLFFVGHSIGGQVLGLAPSSTELEGSILIAASAPYWKRWDFPENLKVFTTSKILFPLISSITKNFPAKKLGLGNQNIPSPLIKTWAQWMSRPDYLFDKSFQLNTEQYKGISHPMYFIGFNDDDLAPEINIKKLMEFYPNSQNSLKIITPESAKTARIGHTGFFHEKFKSNLWQIALDEIKNLERANTA